MINLYVKSNPDILSCLANLSSDEVFTPPKVANDMLDLLPPEVFTNPESKFLDPSSKTGVFLREIVKRLNAGLSDKIPNFNERVNHILKNQIFGLAITHLTSLISRRTVYCSKDASGECSACRFETHEGNILFHDIEHTFDSQGRCIYCGARIESHAYEFIHTLKPEEIFHMKFDVIISNPPYQLNDGGGMGTSAIPIYQKFIEQAIKLEPRYITMIVPSRWFSGGRGLDEFRDKMLHDRHIRELHDFPDATDCFNGVEVKGGVCYFLWDREYNGDCYIKTIQGENVTESTRPLIEQGMSSFVRYNEAVSIIHKVKKFHESSFMSLVNANDPFGYDVRVANSYRRVKPDITYEPFEGSIQIYYYGWQKEGIGYIDRTTVRKNREFIDKYKVLTSKAAGTGKLNDQVLAKPFIAKPGSVCTETYLLIGPFDDESTCKNVMSYIATKFFRFLVAMKKNTQNAHPPVYEFVPMQDFKHSWTDSELYAKYNLDEGEIAFIESMIKPMNLGN